MNLTVVFGALCCVLSGFAIVGWLVYRLVRPSQKKRQSARDELPKVREQLNSLQQRMGGRLEGDTLRFSYRDHEFRVVLTPPRSKSEGSLVVLVSPVGSSWPEEFLPVTHQQRPVEQEAVPHLPTLLMRVERRLDRLGKLLWLNKEVQTGDHDFDKAVYVETDVSSEFAVRLLSESVVRSAASEALSMGYDEFTIFGKHAPVRFLGSVDADLVETEAFARLADRLVAGLSVLPAVKPLSDKAAYEVRDTSLSAFAIGGSLSAFIIVPLVLFLWIPYPTFDGEYAMVGLKLGFVAWLLITMGALVFYRGRSTALRMVLTLSISAMLMGPSLGCMATHLSNGALDWSEGRVVTAKVVSKRISKSDDSTRYLATFSVAGLPRSEFDVGGSLYGRLPQAGGQVRMRIHDGFWGWPWVGRFML